MGNCQVLVVDDESSIVAMIAMILTAEGYQVETANNGMEALRLIEHLRPQLVMLDMRMPVLDGWGFAHALRERNIDLPLLVMTAAQDAGRWADEVGAASYLSKPFDIFDMLQMVKRVCTEGTAAGCS